MKTAISIPDETYERVARENHLNRSQFYAAAAQQYAEELARDDLTDAVNAVVDAVGVDGSAEFAVQVGRRFSADDEW